MSFVIALYVREGIVMAADSRLTLNRTQQGQGGPVVQLAVGQTDSVNKLFLAAGRIGIATYGAADLSGVPIAGFVESFISQKIDSATSVDDAAQSLLDYFRLLSPAAATYFIVAGYGADAAGLPEQRVWTVDVVANARKLVNPPNVQGAQWGGESDIMSRLIQPVWIRDAGGQMQQLPTFPIQWGFFTLQDAIDFAKYAVGSTIESFRFMPRPRTVGGPIDVLVIRPNGADWVRRKELQG